MEKSSLLEAFLFQEYNILMLQDLKSHAYK